jgi:hypothetical protein
MRRTASLSLIVIFISLLHGCGVPQSDYDSLNAENEKLKKEIEELKYGADRLLTDAKAFLGKKDYVNAKKQLELLIRNHPGTKQADEAENLILDISREAPETMIPEVNTDKSTQTILRTTHKRISTDIRIMPVTMTSALTGIKMPIA